ncbi:hypothetical protein Tco_1361276 [Tanacetum coccineum]
MFAGGVLFMACKTDQTAHTCGTTRDGVNDAPALKKGDIRIMDVDATDRTRVASVPKDVAGYVKDATMGLVSDKTKMAKDAAECIKCIKFYLVVGMLKQKLKFQKRYLIHFDKVRGIRERRLDTRISFG